jgi:hypothetical protein
MTMRPNKTRVSPTSFRRLALRRAPANYCDDSGNRGHLNQVFASGAVRFPGRPEVIYGPGSQLYP